MSIEDVMRLIYGGAHYGMGKETDGNENKDDKGDEGEMEDGKEARRAEGKCPSKAFCV